MELLAKHFSTMMALTQTEWVHAFWCHFHQNIEDIYIINYLNFTNYSLIFFYYLIKLF